MNIISDFSSCRFYFFFRFIFKFTIFISYRGQTYIVQCTISMSTLEPGKFKPGKFNHIISPRKAKGLVVRSNYTVIKTTYFLSKSKKKR